MSVIKSRSGGAFHLRESEAALLLAAVVVVGIVIALLVSRTSPMIVLATACVVPWAAIAVSRPSLLIPVSLPLLLFPGPSVPAIGATSNAIIIALAIVWLLGLGMQRWRVYPVHALVGVFAAWLCLGYAMHPHHVGGISSFADLVSLLLGLLLLAVAASMPVSLVWLFRITAVSGFALAIGTLRAPKVLTGAFAASERAAAFGLNSNYLGLQLVLCLVVCLALVFLWRERWALIPAVALVLAVMAAESRGSLVALSVGLALLIWSSSSRRARVLIVVAAVCLIAVGPSMASVSSTVLRSRDVRELSVHNEARSEANLAAARYALENPITGIGYGEFASVAATDPQLSNFIASHNDWLRLAAETGILGAILFGLLSLPAVFRHGRGRGSLVLRALVASTVAGLFFGNTLSNIQVSALLWIPLGILWHRAAEEKALESSLQMPSSATV